MHRSQSVCLCIVPSLDRNPSLLASRCSRARCRPPECVGIIIRQLGELKNHTQCVVEKAEKPPVKNHCEKRLEVVFVIFFFSFKFYLFQLRLAVLKRHEAKQSKMQGVKKKKTLCKILVCWSLLTKWVFHRLIAFACKTGWLSPSTVVQSRESAPCFYCRFNADIAAAVKKYVTTDRGCKSKNI